MAQDEAFILETTKKDKIESTLIPDSMHLEGHKLTIIFI